MKKGLMNSDNLYYDLINLNQNIIRYEKEHGYSPFDEPDDPALKSMISEKNRLQKEIKKCEMISIIENSYIFACDNEYWVSELKKKLEEW